MHTSALSPLLALAICLFTPSVAAAPPASPSTTRRSSDSRADSHGATQRVVPVVMSSPRYLPAARYAHLVGTVIVRVSISPQGRVTAASVVRGVDSLLDTPALRAARLWQFAEHQGSSQMADLSFTYRLSGPEAVSYVPPFSVTIQGGPLDAVYWE